MDMGEYVRKYFIGFSLGDGEIINDDISQFYFPHGLDFTFWIVRTP